MPEFRQFPWRYIKLVLDTREFFFDSSISVTKREFMADAHACPDCGKHAADLQWVPVDTADETWGRGDGRTGFLTCCMECRKQIDFFVDDELTRLESELRTDGKSSQEQPWSESEPSN